MNLLDTLLHRTQAPPSTIEAAMEQTNCPHLALIARWDSVADMGHEERATSYHCETCGEDFTAAEGRMLRASEGERIRMSSPPESLN